MAKNLCTKVGEVAQDNLIAKLFPPAMTVGVRLPGKMGVMKRGTVLIYNGEGAEGIGAANTGKANAILAEDADTGENGCVSVAYISGHFNINALITDGYTLTNEDKASLRNGGILLSEMQ